MNVGSATTFSEVFDRALEFVMEELRLKRSRTPATQALSGSGLGSSPRPQADRVNLLERLARRVEDTFKRSTGTVCISACATIFFSSSSFNIA